MLGMGRYGTNDIVRAKAFMAHWQISMVRRSF